MFIVSKETARKLEELKSSYRITHRNVAGAEETRVDIVDLVTDTVYASHTDVTDKSEEQVLELAVKEAMGTDKPETAPEMIQRLTAENKALRSGTAKRGDVPDGEKQSDPNDPNKMTPSQLVGQLAALGLPIPKGDRRHNTWRTLAIKLLTDGEGEKDSEDEDQDARPEPAPA